MKIATTTAELRPYYQTHLERVQGLHRQGFACVDLSLLHENRPGAQLMCADWKEQVMRLRSFADQHGVQYVQAHLPADKTVSLERMLDAYIRCIEVCGVLGIGTAVIHAESKPGQSKEAFFEENAAFVRRLIPVLEKTGVILCQENTAQQLRPGMYHFCNGTDLAAFCDYVDHPLLQACWDTGHANLEGPQAQEILTLGEHLRAIHLNDNSGKKDEHLLPGEGNMDLGAIMAALHSVQFQGPLTLECDGYLRGAADKKPSLEQAEEHLRYSLAVLRNILKTYGLPEE